jgi:hypothetical protein
VEFTDTQDEILVNAWALAAKGKGQVLEPCAETEADELANAGWLEKRTEDNGDASWWWTPAAEAAVDVIALIESVQGREN